MSYSMVAHTKLDDPTQTAQHTIIADSGATAHYGTETLPILNKIPCRNNILIRAANGNIMKATHEGELDIPALPKAARRILIVPELADKTLMSMSQLCDAGCQITYDSNTVRVYLQGNIVLSGHRMPNIGLWRMELPNNTENNTIGSAGSAIHKNSAAELVRYAHAAMGYPPLATLEQALIKGLVIGFPGLTPRTLRQYPPFSDATAKGHMAQTRKNVRSTKTKTSNKLLTNASPPHYDEQRGYKNNASHQHNPNPNSNLETSQTLGNTYHAKPTENCGIPEKIDKNKFIIDDGENDGNDTIHLNDQTTGNDEYAHYCYETIHRPTHKSYANQTGAFVCEARSGSKYIYTLYDFDSNHIFAIPLRATTDMAITAAFDHAHGQLTKAGMHPRTHILDNQCGPLQRAMLATKNMDFQLVPPGIHRRNAAERAIRTFKDHFISILCGTDDRFPIDQWDKLIPQATITLNLLRSSRINSKQSAYSQIYGPFDYNRTPLAPMGCRVLVHIKPHMRGTWDPKAEDGFYVGPAMNSYRCFQVHINATRMTRVTDTLTWVPGKMSIPSATMNDNINEVVQRAIQAVTDALPDGQSDEKCAALQQIAELFGDGINNPGEMRVVNDHNDNAGKMRVVDTSTIPLLLPLPLPPPPIGIPKPPTAPSPSKPQTENIPTAEIDDKSNTYAEITGIAGAKNRRNQRKRGKPTKLRNNHATHTEHIFHVYRSYANSDAEFLACYGHAINPDTKKLAEYHDLIKSSDAPYWIEGMEDEWGRLANGNDRIPIGTNTLRFVTKDEIPKNYIPTYVRIVVAYRPEKEKPYRVRLTVGGDRVIFHGECSTKAADLSTVKILLNSVISTPGARFMTLDIKDFYLNTLMKYDDRVYMRIPERAIPESIKNRYNVKIVDKMAYVEVTKGMYGLKQAGRLANEQLTEFLAEHGYSPVPITPGLWKHESRNIIFSLVVDDFGIKYISDDDKNHLIGVLRKKYKVSEDHTGTKYCGLQIDWDYQRGTCDISMPGYITRALARFQHVHDGKPQHAPQPCTPPIYGAKVQFADAPDESPTLKPAETKRLQEILGTLLYYARAVDSTILVALGTLASEPTRGTEQTMKLITHLLNYCATHPEAKIRFNRSDMVLHVESDASYLSLPNATSRVAGYHYLSDKPAKPGIAPAPDDPMPPINGAINVICNILRVVVSSAAEAEMAGLFHNAKEACALRTTLTEMGHDQPATPLVTDNSTASGVVNDTVKQKQSKAMDMRFYWVRDRTKQGQFVVFWRKGSINRADYFSKDHPASHHQDQRQNYIHLTYDDEVSLQVHYAMSTSIDYHIDEVDHLALFYAASAPFNQDPQD